MSEHRIKPDPEVKKEQVVQSHDIAVTGESSNQSDPMDIKEEDDKFKQDQDHDEGDDLDDLDDEDDEDDDEDDNLRSRKKRRGGNQFLDVEAEVDDDDEEEEDDDEVEQFQREFLADGHEGEDEQAPGTSDRLHRKLDRSRERLDEQDAQELAEQFKQRYGRSTSSRYMGSNANVSQRLLLPSVDDPLIWGIRVRNGKEKELVKTLHARMLNKKGTNEVFSVFQRDSFIGYIYIEARRLDAVNKILEGLPGVYSSNKVLVPIEEYPDLLRPGRSEDIQLQPGAYVRVKIGRYKGDLGIIDNLADNDLEARVKLIPRLDYGKSATQTVFDSASGETKKKRAPFYNSKFRPPQRLFSEFEATQNDPEHLSTAKRDRGYFIYKNEEYINGFLYKDIKISQLDTRNIKPTLQELTLFNNDDTAEGLQSVAASLKETTIKAITFQTDDRVEIVSGEQAKMKGSVVAATDAKIVRVLLEGNEDSTVDNTIVEVPVSALRKVFLLGDHVTVIHGVHAEESGLIVQIEDNQVTLISNQTKKDITVFPNYLMKSIDSSTTSSQIGRFELHQLVQLNAMAIGLIIRAEKEVFTVLCTDGRVLQVEPRSIQSVVEMNRLTEKTNDKNGLEVKVGDVVKESTGERRQGNILHIYRSYLFLKSKTVTENTGIFVVNASDCQTVSSKGSILSTFNTPDLNKMNPDRLMPPPAVPIAAAKFSGRDITLNQHVSVRKGPYKGKKGIIKDANGEIARVEMHNPAKIIPINKSDLLFEMRPGTFIPYEQFLENYRTRRTGGSGFQASAAGHGGNQGGYTPGYGSGFANGSRRMGSSLTPAYHSEFGHSNNGPAGGRTPAWGAGGKTPAWSSGGKTPAWGSSSSGGKTPAWSSGARTPASAHGSGSGSGSKTPAWGSGGKTPAWSNGGGKTPAWSSGGKTPAWGSSSGNKTPAWGSSSGGKTPGWEAPSGGKTPSWESTPGSSAGWDSVKEDY